MATQKILQPPKDALAVIHHPSFAQFGIRWVALRYDWGQDGKATRCKISAALVGVDELITQGIDILFRKREETNIIWGALGEWVYKEAQIKRGYGN